MSTPSSSAMQSLLESRKSTVFVRDTDPSASIATSSRVLTSLEGPSQFMKDPTISTSRTSRTSSIQSSETPFSIKYLESIEKLTKSKFPINYLRGANMTRIVDNSEEEFFRSYLNTFKSKFIKQTDVTNPSTANYVIPETIEGIESDILWFYKIIIETYGYGKVLNTKPENLFIHILKLAIISSEIDMANLNESRLQSATRDLMKDI